VQAEEAVNLKYADKDVIIAFGRHFISNSDLLFSIKESLKLNAYIRDLFYTLESPDGYTIYPLSSQWLERNILKPVATTTFARIMLTV
jgi:NADPH2 dehydrogenase